MRRTARFDQYHAVLAQRNENGAEPALRDKGARRGDDLRWRADRHSRRLGELAAIWLQHAGAAIGVVVGPLGVDDHRLTGGARGGNDGGGDPFTHRPLGVVGDDDDFVLTDRLLDEAQEIRPHIGPERRDALAIGAQHLLIGGNIARLHRGDAPGLDENV